MRRTPTSQSPVVARTSPRSRPRARRWSCCGAPCDGHRWDTEAVNRRMARRLVDVTMFSWARIAILIYCIASSLVVCPET
eukprot:3743368-Prymnesium_polylepis.1